MYAGFVKHFLFNNKSQKRLGSRDCILNSSFRKKECSKASGNGKEEHISNKRDRG